MTMKKRLIVLHKQIQIVLRLWKLLHRKLVIMRHRMQRDYYRCAIEENGIDCIREHNIKSLNTLFISKDDCISDSAMINTELKWHREVISNGLSLINQNSKCFAWFLAPFHHIDWVKCPIDPLVKKFC